MIQDNQLDNMLVKQKDMLIKLIDNARSIKELESITRTLFILTELWDICYYGYKKDELIERIKRKTTTIRKTNKQDKGTTSSSGVPRRSAKEGS